MVNKLLKNKLMRTIMMMMVTQVTNILKHIQTNQQRIIQRNRNRQKYNEEKENAAREHTTTALHQHHGWAVLADRQSCCAQLKTPSASVKYIQTATNTSRHMVVHVWRAHRLPVEISHEQQCKKVHKPSQGVKQYTLVSLCRHTYSRSRI